MGTRATLYEIDMGDMKKALAAGLLTGGVFIAKNIMGILRERADRHKGAKSSQIIQEQQQIIHPLRDGNKPSQP
ncbi:MAG: hypothetical protein ACYDER_16440 [Ktedonobacteraceae bacterium]